MSKIHLTPQKRNAYSSLDTQDISNPCRFIIIRQGDPHGERRSWCSASRFPREDCELSPVYFDLYESEQAELYCRLSHNSSAVESPRGGYCFRRENLLYKIKLVCFVLFRFWQKFFWKEHFSFGSASCIQCIEVYSVTQKYYSIIIICYLWNQYTHLV